MQTKAPTHEDAMKQTIQDRLAAALVARGERELPSKSGKYRTFSRKTGGFYFLGRSGALRFGDCSSKSIALHEGAKQQLLNLANEVNTNPHGDPQANLAELIARQQAAFDANPPPQSWEPAAARSLLHADNETAYGDNDRRDLGDRI